MATFPKYAAETFNLWRFFLKNIYPCHISSPILLFRTVMRSMQ